jgi:hypothetical protein
MAHADSGRAIGAVTRVLHTRLYKALSSLSAPQVPITDVTIGRPEPAAKSEVARLNLFLYEVEFDGHLKNVTLDEGQPAPMWLVLRYLLTTFDKHGESDTDECHDILGEAVRALQDLNFLTPPPLQPLDAVALGESPDRLKITFEHASSELLSRIMNGSDERYRCGVAFQVRPVMIAPGQPPSYSLLVGVNYETGAIITGEAAIEIPVLPSMGPVISSVTPQEFETGTDVTVEGTDLHLDGLSVQLGPAELAVTMQRPDRLTFHVSPTLDVQTDVRAGSLSLEVVQALPFGKRRKSNPLIAGLLPRLDTVTPSGLVGVAPSMVYGLLTVRGALLGTANDEVYVALYKDGKIVRMFDDFDRPGGALAQDLLRVDIPDDAPVPAGDYLVIVRVNGRQARNSPRIALTP